MTGKPVEAGESGWLSSSGEKLFTSVKSSPCREVLGPMFMDPHWKQFQVKLLDLVRS